MHSFYCPRNAIEIPLKRQPTFEVVSHPLFNCALCHLQERNSPPVARLRFQSGVCQQKRCFTTVGGSTRKTFYRFHFFPTRCFLRIPGIRKFFLTVPPMGVCGKMCLFLLGIIGQACKGLPDPRRGLPAFGFFHESPSFLSLLVRWVCGYISQSLPSI